MKATDLLRVEEFSHAFVLRLIAAQQFHLVRMVRAHLGSATIRRFFGYRSSQKKACLGAVFLVRMVPMTASERPCLIVSPLFVFFDIGHLVLIHAFLRIILCAFFSVLFMQVLSNADVSPIGEI